MTIVMKMCLSGNPPCVNAINLGSFWEHTLHYPCQTGSVAPQCVEAELARRDGTGGGKARGGGGASAVLAGPPFLQREKRLV